MFSDYFSRSGRYVLDDHQLSSYDEAVIYCQRHMDMTSEEACEYVTSLEREARRTNRPIPRPERLSSY